MRPPWLGCRGHAHLEPNLRLQHRVTHAVAQSLHACVLHPTLAVGTPRQQTLLHQRSVRLVCQHTVVHKAFEPQATIGEPLDRDVPRGAPDTHQYRRLGVAAGSLANLSNTPRVTPAHCETAATPALLTSEPPTSDTNDALWELVQWSADLFMALCSQECVRRVSDCRDRIQQR